jgi:hypothetical protein
MSTEEPPRVVLTKTGHTIVTVSDAENATILSAFEEEIESCLKITGDIGGDDTAVDVDKSRTREARMERRRQNESSTTSAEEVAPSKATDKFVEKNEWAPGPTQDYNSAKVSDVKRFFLWLLSFLPLLGSKKTNIPVYGDMLSNRNLELAKSGQPKLSHCSSQPGFFHYIWNVAMGILWKMWWPELKVVADQLGEKCYKNHTKVRNQLF